MALLLTALAASLALVNCAPTSASQLNVIRARLPRRGYVSPATREHDRRKLQRRSTVPLTVNAPGGEDIEFLVDVLAGTPQQCVCRASLARMHTLIERTEVLSTASSTPCVAFRTC